MPAVEVQPLVEVAHLVGIEGVVKHSDDLASGPVELYELGTADKEVF